MTTRMVFVPGVPVPQGSSRIVNRTRNPTITHDNPAVMPWRADVQAHIRSAIGPGIVFPAGGVAVDVLFVMPRRAREPKRPVAHTRKPDLDKLARGVLDALTGLVFTDDAQVTHLAVSKVIADEGEFVGATIRWEADDAE